MDSDILRWLLLIIAVAVLFFWYMSYLFTNRRGGTATTKKTAEQSHENAEQVDNIIRDESPKPAQASKKRISPDQLIILAVDAKNNEEFSGSEIVSLLETRGLKIGKHSIYHRHIQSEGSERLVYSVINGIEPGYLDDTFLESTTPSIMFFLDLKQSHTPDKHFSEMLEAAQYLASQLAGSVCDSDHNPLTDQTITYIRETIREKERSNYLQTNA